MTIKHTAGGTRYEQHGTPRVTTAMPPAEHTGLAGSVCVHCSREIKVVPGGSGPIWVHADGYRVCSTK